MYKSRAPVPPVETTCLLLSASGLSHSRTVGTKVVDSWVLPFVPLLELPVPIWSFALSSSGLSSRVIFTMIRSAVLAASIGLAGFVQAQCPFADIANLAVRAEGLSRDHLSEFEVDDSEGFMTSDVGGPIEDQEVLTAGDRGPTLLEDFIFRQKITHFDHERVGSREPFH